MGFLKCDGTVIRLVLGYEQLSLKRAPRFCHSPAQTWSSHLARLEASKAQQFLSTQLGAGVTGIYGDVQLTTCMLGSELQSSF